MPDFFLVELLRMRHGETKWNDMDMQYPSWSYMLEKSIAY